MPNPDDDRIRRAPSRFQVRASCRRAWRAAARPAPWPSFLLASACMLVATLVTAQGRSGQPSLPFDIAPEWELIGQSNGLRTVFIAEDGLKDRHFVIQVLRRVVETVPRGRRLEVLIFDDRFSTPSGRPTKPREWACLRARYTLDPAAKAERFVWVSIEDHRVTPPKLKETEAPIGLGRAG